jgi:membrane protease YdiL (CAAX protease family)
MREMLIRRPVLSFALLAIVPTWAVQFTFLAMGWEFFPALLAEIVFLVGAATVVTAAEGGRAAVKRLFAGTVRWRMGAGWFAVAGFAIPLVTLALAAGSGSLRTPAGGWLAMVGGYLLMAFVLGAVLGNVWEELAWTGFVQRRLMERHGLLGGALLTAIPFALIHLPISATSWPALIVLVVAAPFFRYLFGMIYLDTRGSILAVGITHASFNASQQLGAVRGQWQALVALLVVIALIALYRRTRRGAAAAEPSGEVRGAGVRV